MKIDDLKARQGVLHVAFGNLVVEDKPDSATANIPPSIFSHQHPTLSTNFPID